jgi:hypothetical protein
MQAPQNQHLQKNGGMGGGLDRLHFVILPLLGAALLLTNRWFTEVDDECAIIDRAARPIVHTISLYLTGAGEHEHPPLYDLILHGWLRLTGGEQHLLRLPAVLFYLAGAWVLANAAKRQAGRAAQGYTLLLVALWPYGFHFGRLATWYSFCFLLVSLLTWNYFRYLESPRLRNWCWLILSSLLLLYSNYFGWALLGCLALDFIIQNRNMPRKAWAQLAGTGLLLLAAYVPIARAFVGEIHESIEPNSRIATLFLTGLYNFYSVFVSESVAPWFWFLGVPVAAAIVICLVMTFVSVPHQAKRFLLYFTGLLAVMTLLGIANTKRMLFISPLLILPVGIALTATTGKPARRVLSGALLVIAAIGWYGIVSRAWYAAPHWIEPWETISQESANLTRSGGIVIGDNPSFFFYLTYALPPVTTENGQNFDGLLPDSTRRRNVYNGPQWLTAGRPVAARMFLVKGPHYQIPAAPMDEAEHWLNGRCVVENTERMVHDPGAEWKQRFAPDTGQVPWRIEVVTYGCNQ